MDARRSRRSFAPRQRGAWIETHLEAGHGAHQAASLPGNGERGLKLTNDHVDVLHTQGFAPRQRGAWIETL